VPAIDLRSKNKMGRLSSECVDNTARQGASCYAAVNVRGTHCSVHTNVERADSIEQVRATKWKDVDHAMFIYIQINDFCGFIIIDIKHTEFNCFNINLNFKFMNSERLVTWRARFS
jgi:hypothetical protein